MKIYIAIAFSIFYGMQLSAQSIELSTDQIPDSLYRNANAIVRVDNREVHFNKYDEYTLKRKFAITVLNKKGAELLAFKAYYKEGSQKVENIKISIWDKKGARIKEIKSKEVEDYIARDGISMVSDQRVKVWRYEPRAYPITLYYEYDVISQNTMTLPQWSPIMNHHISICQSSYTLLSSLEVRAKELNFDQYATISISANGYEMKNQPATIEEEYSPAVIRTFPMAFFTPVQYTYEGRSGKYENWEGYGTWIYDQFLSPQAGLDLQSVSADLSHAITPDDSDHEKIKKLYDYVQENTRYISIALDEGGLNPLSPQKVHEVKYGDCKALSFYMKSLLELYHISSDYAEVHADSDHKIDLMPDYPGPIPGNHIILHIPTDQDTVWLDCTSHDNPFNFLGSFTDDRYALLIKPSGSHLVKTPKYSYKDNVIQSKTKLDLSDVSNAKFDIAKNYRGIYISQELYRLKQSDEDLRKHLIEQRYKTISNLKIEHIGSEVMETELSLSENIKMSSSSFAEITGNYAFISLTFDSFDIPKLPKDKSRKNPIEFPRGYTFQSEIQINIPEGYELTDAQGQKVETEYGKYSKSIETTETGIIILKRSFELYQGTYDEGQYNRIKSFADECIKSERTQIIINK